MQIHCERCPNCFRPFYFPVEYPGDHFPLLCPHCHVGYNMMGVQVSEEFLGNLLHSHRTASLLQKPGISKSLFQYLRSVAGEFRFAPPAEPNAIVFLVAQTHSPFPIAAYFQNTYHRTRTFNRLQFSASLSTIGALILLGNGLSFIPVLIGTTLAMLCFWRLTSLPKMKQTTRHRLAAEQSLLRQCHDLQQALNQVLQLRLTYQNYLKRQRSVLEKMMQNPDLYPTQVDLYQRSLKCTQDYLELCDRAIDQYEAAIHAIAIQIETSKLSVELSSNLTVPKLEFELKRLEDQLVSSVPPKLFDYDSNDDYSLS